MSDFPLTGVQYRPLKAQFPSGVWRQDCDYEDWQDVTDFSKVYSTGTQFRMKPQYKYEVSSDNRIKSYANKDKAMSAVAEALAEGISANIRRVDETPDLVQFLFNKNVEFQTAGTGRWTAVTYLKIAGLDYRTQLRIRPDNYWTVNTSVGISKSSLDFKDIDELAKYVDKQIRTNNNADSITIFKKNYV